VELRSMLGDEPKTTPDGWPEPGLSSRADARQGSEARNPYGSAPGDQVDNPTFDLALYWSLLLKHRLLAIGSVMAALAIGLAATLLMTPRYTATATLQIDREAARVLNSEDEAPRESLIQGEEFF